MAIVYSTPFLHIHVDRVGGVLETEWLEFANSQQLRSALEEALRIGRQYRVRGWIGNNKKMRTIRPTDQVWMNTVWFLGFEQLKVRALAVVVSDDALNQMGIDNIVSQATEHIPYATHYFVNVEEARAWAATLAHAAG